MAMNKIIKLIAVLASLFVLTACPDFEDHCSSEIYDFSMPIQLKVSKDTLNIGDTLWFESSFSSTVRDTLLKKDIYYPNGEIQITFYMVEYQLSDNSNNKLIDALPSFHKVVNKEGANSSFARISYYYDPLNELYEFRVGYVAKKKGEFLFSYIGSEADQVGVKCDKIDLVNPYTFPKPSHNLFPQLHQKYNITSDWVSTDQVGYNNAFGFVVK
ncbi:MAG: hypothetical protein OHK0038_02250 [Flammeovirgaceae bacterium]